MEYSKLKYWGTLFITFVIGWGLSFLFHTKTVKIEDKLSNTEYATTTSQKPSNATEIPNYVSSTLDYIAERNTAPDGYVGGRMFQNREGLLPKSTSTGTKIYYREWDVHPKINGQNRGAERLVTSDQGDAYFTIDHYKSFKKIK